jgi:hypothetical protein
LITVFILIHRGLCFTRPRLLGKEQWPPGEIRV